MQKEVDERALLAEMETLANEAGDWRGHLLYEDALRYHEIPEIQARYRSHIDECRYCQQLIDTLHPSDRMLNELHAALIKRENSTTRQESSQQNHLEERMGGGSNAVAHTWLWLVYSRTIHERCRKSNDRHLAEKLVPNSSIRAVKQSRG